MAKQFYLNGNRTLADYMPALPKHYDSFHAHFDSYETLCRAVIEETPKKTTWCNRHVDDRGSFYGNVTWEETQKLALEGWAEGAARVVALRDRINIDRPHALKLVRYDMAGALPNVQRFIAGNPLHMRRMEVAETRKRPVLTLQLSMWGSAYVEANCFTNRAAVVAAIVDVIEEAGYRVHLIANAISVWESNKFTSEIAYTVKEPDHAFEIARAAFALGHVGMFRRFVFGLQGVRPECERITSSMGRPAGKLVAPRGVYLLPFMNDVERDFRTAETAATVGLDGTIAELARQGCPAFRDHAAFTEAA
jgi:hypothetical protein